MTWPWKEPSHGWVHGLVTSFSIPLDQSLILLCGIPSYTSFRRAWRMVGSMNKRLQECNLVRTQRIQHLMADWITMRLRTSLKARRVLFFITTNLSHCYIWVLLCVQSVSWWSVTLWWVVEESDHYDLLGMDLRCTPGAWPRCQCC